jgi:hypothetical protein
MNRWTTLTFLALLLLPGCGPNSVALQRKPLARPNPTNFVFDASVAEVKLAVKKWYDKRRHEELKANKTREWPGHADEETRKSLTGLLRLPPAMLFWKGDADALAKFLLTKPGDENDAYFYATDSPVGLSQVYFKDGQSLIYFADFHIHLAELGPMKTRVEITTYDPVVNTTARGPWSLERGGRPFIYVPVDPTTVEEYQILRGIGEQLGATNMPAVLVPDSNAPAQPVTKRIRR